MKRVRSDYGAYTRQAKKWLVGKRCARCGTTQELTVHHRAGREGRLLHIKRHWLPLCMRWPLRCHDWVELHKHAAAKLGWVYEVNLTTGKKITRERINR